MNTASPFDPRQFKDATRGHWDRSAQGWSDQSNIIRGWLRGATDAMLAMAEVGPGMRVLDVAAGAGDQTLDIAERVGPTGFVLATDLSPAILALADDRLRRAGIRNVEARAADGEDLGGLPAHFDAAICRLGLMFFPDPARGLGEMFRLLKPGGRACTVVFSTPEKNPCVSILMAVALAHAGLPLRDPDQPGGLLSLGKAGLTDALFRQAGFSLVATTRLNAPFRLPCVGDYLDFIRMSASPILQILDRLDESRKRAAWAEIEDRLDAFATPDGWEGPNELLLTIGRRP
ncbi:MAG: class I SAM-dependent methyltransferase [Rhodoplanes sp.]|uniref:class I SAM-dependent methyltransferase n=1 Tax=Rhodoplanes sp. TaxID=1968906 RepID=UPI0017D18D36|nr:class I SAM-dependent methyltransferase [Rhodoplanes sp.]NVO12401.1 class I SAM-dependent methyltransferase [Rhodoplanes sp.]